jgi:hypothetical protein
MPAGLIIDRQHLLHRLDQAAPGAAVCFPQTGSGMAPVPTRGREQKSAEDCHGHFLPVQATARVLRRRGTRELVEPEVLGQRETLALV